MMPSPSITPISTTAIKKHSNLFQEASREAEVVNCFGGEKIPSASYTGPWNCKTEGGKCVNMSMGACKWGNCENRNF